MKKYLKNLRNFNNKEYFHSHFPNRCFICKKEINLISDLNLNIKYEFIYPSCNNCKNIQKNVNKKKIERFLYSDLKYNVKKDIGYLRTLEKNKRGYRITSLLKREFKKEDPPNWWINKETKKTCKYLNSIGDL